LPTAPELLPELACSQDFLRENLYHHYQVLRMTDKARRIIQDLFGAFMNDPRLLPPQYQLMARTDKPRAIADYIAGMTDRYAMRSIGACLPSARSIEPGRHAAAQKFLEERAPAAVYSTLAQCV
jgi:dGTP triphosphohydrolase